MTIIVGIIVLIATALLIIPWVSTIDQAAEFNVVEEAESDEDSIFKAHSR